MSSIRGESGEGDVSEQGNEWRDSEPFDAKKYKNFYQLAGGAFITVVILLIGGFIYSNPDSGYWVNIYATIVGTILTIAVLDRRAEQRTIRERKEELILQMGSPDNAFAVEAVRLLKQKGYMVDGTLIGIDLQEANLRGAHLEKANMQKVNLTRTILQNAVLMGANLQNTYLTSAQLKNANLRSAKMQKALLPQANLQGANLKSANLQGAILFRVNLQDVEFDNLTNLPDGTYWTPNRDLREFTHPDQWQAAKQSDNAT